MQQNEIETFADKIFQNLILNRPQLGSALICSKEDSINDQNHKITTETQENGRNFRQIKKSMGLSKADIDKLELMCAGMHTKDYLNRLIKIHEEENMMRNEVQIIVSDPSFHKIYRNKFQLSEGLTQNENNQRPISIKSETDKNEHNINISKVGVARQEVKTSVTIKQEQKNRMSKQKCKSNRKSFSTQLEKFIFKQKSCSPRKSSLLKPNLCDIIQKQNQQKIYQKKAHEKYPLKINSKHLNNVEKNTFAANGETDRDQNNIPTINSGLNTVRSLQVEGPFSCQSVDDVSHDRSLNQKSQPKEDEECFNGNLYHENEVSQSKQLEEMCYTEIGRRMVFVTQKQARRQFFKTNLHIRPYIMKNILFYTKCLAQYSPTSIFILPNERALHFDPQTKPQQLSQHIEQTKYAEIIKNVNHIIQKNIFKQRYKKEHKSLWPYCLLIMFFAFIVMMCLVVFVNGEGRTEQNVAGEDLLRNAIMIITGLLISVILVILIGYSLHLYPLKSNFIPVCDVIYADIGNYFKFLNGKMQNDLEWIVGESFYWLQVKIKKKQKEQKQKPVCLQIHRLKKTKRVYYKDEQDEVIEN